jgi:hypothetical protein
MLSRVRYAYRGIDSLFERAPRLVTDGLHAQPSHRTDVPTSLGTRERLRRHMANDLSEASDRRNTLRLGANSTPRAHTPKDCHVTVRLICIVTHGPPLKTVVPGALRG